MLRQMRAASKTWVAKALMAALVASFAAWGVSSGDTLFNAIANSSVATVGDSRVGDTEYNRELQSALRRLNAENKTELTLEQARAQGLDTAILNLMIDRAALDEKIAEYKLVASNAAVQAQLRSTPAFRGTDGAYSAQVAQQVLSNAQITVPQYVDSIRSDIVRFQLLVSLAGSLATPPGMTALIADYLAEQRDVEYVVVRPEDVGTIPAPSDADLAAYHTANAAKFSSPEYRAIDYVVIAPEAFAGDMTVTDDELRKAYEARQSELGKPEQRDIEQILFTSQAEAEAAAQRIASGTDFMAIARERNLKDEEVKLGTLKKTDIAPALGEAAFATPEGKTSPPVQGPFGWVILRVAKVTPSTVPSFEAARDQLRLTVATDKAATKVEETNNTFEDARGSGANLPEAATRVGLAPVHVGAVDAQGMAPDGTKVTLPAEVLQLAFTTESGEESPSARTQDKQYVAVRVASITPPAVKPLDAVREEVRQGWAAEERSKRQAEKAKTLFDQAKADKSLAGVARTLGHAVATEKGVKRGMPVADFGPELMDVLFAVPKGEAVTGLAGTNPVIARVIGVEHPAPDLSSQDYATIAQQLGQGMASDLQRSITTAARDEAGVTIHQDVVDRVVSNQ